MSMPKSIALTTDFSPLSREAFPAAADLAGRFDAELHLLHIVREPEIVMPWQIPPRGAEEVRQRLAAAQRRLEDLAASESVFDRLEVHPQALVGEPARALCEFQAYADIGLVITASHGRTGPDHFSLGSFAAKILQLVSCPVLIFRQGEAAAEPGAPFVPRRILVPHDFSRAAFSALDVAHDWAREFEAAVRLLFVVDTDDFHHDQTGEPPSDFLGRAQSEAQRHLELLIRPDIREDAVVRVGHPALEIFKEVRDSGADLVIMASRGRSDLERLHLGAVGERTVNGVHCPVLIVKQSK